MKVMECGKNHHQFVLCIRSGDFEDLEMRKAYQILPDESASKNGYLRVVDESGEDYLYPADHFVPLELSPSVVHMLLRAV
jgi:hypothetical protein